MEFRQAQPADLEHIQAFDHVARVDPKRVEFLRNAIAAELMLVADFEGAVVGYGVLDQSFYGWDFVPLLYVCAERRREGIGTCLLRLLEERCETTRLFTSTNESNEAMHALLAGLGYDRSGIIHNLDPGDPEIVYFKDLRSRSA